MNTIKKGSTGKDVVALQNLLGISGVDGIFGSHTETIVMQFQKDQGLTPDGIVGKGTWSKIGHTRPFIMINSKGTAVKGLQTVLGVTADGIFGATTQSTVKRFQSNNKLVSDGKVGAKTWATLLGVESPINPTIEPKSEHFKLEEMRCKDGSLPPVEYWGNVQKLFYKLEELRKVLGKSIYIMSGYRSVKYNKNCGGAPKSQHLYGSAADIQVSGMSPSEVYKKADKVFTNGGVGKYSGFTHVDVRNGKSRW